MPSERKPAPRKRPAADHVSTVPMTPLRTLGSEERAQPPTRPVKRADEAARKKAKQVLREEFDRILELKAKLESEQTEGARGVERSEEKLRGLIASLEGMSRFALRMGLITPAESREQYARAMERGLYAGWKK